MRIEKALNALNGVTAAVDVPTTSAKIDWDGAETNWSDIIAALQKIGYPPAA